jgi:hypothetical protein
MCYPGTKWKEQEKKGPASRRDGTIMEGQRRTIQERQEYLTKHTERHS